MTDTFMIALPLQGRTVVMFGGCDESARRTEQLMADGATVRVIWPSIGPALRTLGETHGDKLTLCEREIDVETDLASAFLGVMVPQDPALGAKLYAYAQPHQRLFCAIDQPDFCTFYHVATVRRGPMRFGISSGGVAPGLAKRFKEILEDALTPEFTQFAEHWAKIRQAAPKGGRMEATSGLLKSFFLEIRWSTGGTTNQN